MCHTRSTALPEGRGILLGSSETFSGPSENGSPPNPFSGFQDPPEEALVTPGLLPGLQKLTKEERLPGQGRWFNRWSTSQARKGKGFSRFRLPSRTPGKRLGNGFRAPGATIQGTRAPRTVPALHIYGQCMIYGGRKSFISRRMAPSQAARSKIHCPASRV